MLQGWIVGCGWNCVRQSEAERASESLDLDLFVADAIQFMATSPGGQTRTRVSGLVCFPLSLHIPAVGFQMLWGLWKLSTYPSRDDPVSHMKHLARTRSPTTLPYSATESELESLEGASVLTVSVGAQLDLSQYATRGVHA